MARWKEAGHAQHCLAHHLEPGGCPRGRACAFLHADAVAVAGESAAQLEVGEAIAG